MIIWLSSYPKSGNTFLRALLTSYFLTKDGMYDEKQLLKITQFPSIYLFRKYGFETSSNLGFVKNYINVQIKMNSVSGKKVRYLKTHSALLDINGYKFTDIRNTLGVIYIVRDPRTIIKSYANYFQCSLKESTNRITSFLKLTDNDKENLLKYKKKFIVSHVGSWSQHYHSWKIFRDFDKYLLIKYEDLVNDTEGSLIKILSFIYKLNRSKIVLDRNKLKNTIQSTHFDSMRKIDQKGFIEAPIAESGNKKINFFKYGLENNNVKEIPEALKIILENKFENELKELNYI